MTDDGALQHRPVSINRETMVSSDRAERPGRGQRGVGKGDSPIFADTKIGTVPERDGLFEQR